MTMQIDKHVLSSTFSFVAPSITLRVDGAHRSLEPVELQGKANKSLGTEPKLLVGSSLSNFSSNTIRRIFFIIIYIYHIMVK